MAERIAEHLREDHRIRLRQGRAQRSRFEYLGIFRQQRPQVVDLALVIVILPALEINWGQSCLHVFPLLTD